MNAQTCCGRVKAEGFRGTSPCRAAGKVERDGRWYCGRHDPVAREAKDQARNAAWSAKWKLRNEQHEALAATRMENDRRAGLYDELLAALIAMHEAFWGTSHSTLEDEANALAKAAIIKATGTQ